MVGELRHEDVYLYFGKVNLVVRLYASSFINVFYSAYTRLIKRGKIREVYNLFMTTKS